MRDAELADRLAADLLLLAQFRAELRHVRADLTCWRDRAAGAQAGGSRGGGGPSNPTAVQALVDDRARRYLQRRLAQMDDALGALHDAATVLEGLRREVTRTRAEVPGQPGCVNCAQVRERGQPLWSPVHDRTRHLCRWCFDFLDAWGERPCVALVAYHVRDGGKVTNRVIAEHMPDLAAKRPETRRRPRGGMGEMP